MHAPETSNILDARATLGLASPHIYGRENVIKWDNEDVTIMLLTISFHISSYFYV